MAVPRRCRGADSEPVYIFVALVHNLTVGQRLLEFRDLFFADLRVVEVKPSKALQIRQRSEVVDLCIFEEKQFKAVQIRQRS